jgi:hypothetical protein
MASRESMKRGAVIIAIAVALVLVLPASALGVAAFRTPHKAAYCGFTATAGHLLCWTPNDGFTVDMGGRSHVRKRYISANRGYFDPAPARVLRFGQSWRSGPFQCASARSGLTCTNGGRHGWWLGRFRGYRIF